jgi:hypothetical protein
MTNDEILAMAKQCGVMKHYFRDELLAFARLIEQATREADAQIAESEADDAKYNGVESACLRIAELVRSQK